MKINSLSAILHALNHADVRYLIAGGVAVNLHGYQRLTHDLDLVIQLEQSNIRQAMGRWTSWATVPPCLSGPKISRTPACANPGLNPKG